MKLNEVCVAVVGFPNYEVSNYGRVINVRTGRDLKIMVHGATGRLYVQLYRRNKKYMWYVHRLVARAFFLDYSESISVDFINGNQEDISVLNLTLNPDKTPKGPPRGIDGC